MIAETDIPASITDIAVIMPQRRGELRLPEKSFAMTMNAMAVSLTMLLPTESVDIPRIMAPVRAAAA